MADKNPFDNPEFGKPANAFDDPDLGKPSSIVRRTVGDAATGLVKGVVGLPQAALGLADLATGGMADRAGGLVRQGADHIANTIGDAITGKTVGRDFGTTGDLASQGIQGTQDSIDKYYSPEAKAALAAAHDKSVEYGKAGGEIAGTPGRIAGEFAGAVTGAVQNPSALIPLIGESAPSMVVPAGVAGKVTSAVAERAAMKAAAGGASRAEAVAAGHAAAEKFVEGKAGIATTSLAEGLLGGGQNAAQAKSDVLSMPADKLAEMQPYKDLIASGVSPADARLQLAEAAESQTAAISGALSALAGPIAGRFEARAGAKIFGGQAGAKLGPVAGARNGLQNAGAEGLQETFQSAGEQLGQNIGMRAVNPNQDLSEGVGEQAGMGAIAGLAMGGAGHALSSGVIGKAAQAAGLQTGEPQKLLAPPRNDLVDGEAGINPLIAAHAVGNAQAHANEVYAARAAKEAELAQFASNGVVSTAAAIGMSNGATQTAAEKRQADIQETLNPATPLALPAPVGEKEKLEQAKVDDYLANKDSMSLTEAQAVSFNGVDRGHELTVVPHPGGQGYTTIPTRRLSDRQSRAVESIQRPDQGQLPSPNAEKPGAWVAPEGRTPEAQTYGNDPVNMRVVGNQWRKDMGTPVPRSIPPQAPIADAKSAAQIAERKTQETGREHEVVPHPLSSSKFAVAPVPQTIEGTATRVTDQPKGATSASQETASPQRQGPSVSNDQADGARPGEAAPGAGIPAAEAAQEVAPVGSSLISNPESDQGVAAAGPTSVATQINDLVRDAATSPENDRPHPTAGQSEAGNYKKVRIPPKLLHGLEVTIENPAGSVRVAKDGSWASAMPSHYGYIRRSEGNDGDHVDTFVGPKPESTRVFVVDQVDPKTGKFDEHKVMLGFSSKEAAEAGYKAAYPADWKGMSAITATDPEKLKEWLRAGKATEPFGKGKPTGLDSRYVHNIDDDADFETTTDPDADPLISRLTGQPSMESTDLGGAALGKKSRGIVAAALSNLINDLGMPRSMFAGLAAFVTKNRGGEAEYNWSPQAISIHLTLLSNVNDGDGFAARTLRGDIAHEVFHHIDNGDDAFHSAVSPLFEMGRNERGRRAPKGAIAMEAWQAYLSGPEELQNYWRYPFDDISREVKGRSFEDQSQVLQNEIFAQLGRLYITNPKLMRGTMPKAFSLIEGIVNDIRAGEQSAVSIDAARRAVQRALRPRPAGRDDAVNDGRRGDRAVEERARDGQTGAGLGGEQSGLLRATADQARTGDRGRRGNAGLEAASRPAVGEAQALTGAPDTYAPSAVAQKAARDYMKKAGLPYNPPTNYVKVDPERAKRIAEAYDNMQHAPKDGRVRMAYAAMIKETLAQWEAIKATGLKVTFAVDGKPYPYTLPGEVFKDVAENNHMWVFPTVDGFGSDASVDVSDNPLLAPTDETIDGHKLVANDVFRIVHDYFGHIKNGVGFRANGEENAWRAHAAMYSPMARAAMTSETRGQNSWVNYGPHGEANRTASQTDTVYAPQKAGLLPKEFTEDNHSKPDTLDVREIAAIEPTMDDFDDEGVRGQRTAFFGDGDASITYREGRGAPRLMSISTEGDDTVRGQDMVAWLGRKYGKLPIVEDVVPKAVGFWEKMLERGLIRDWSPVSFGKPDTLEAREPGEDIKSAMVNIGLDTPDGKGITPMMAARELKAVGVRIKAREIRKSKTEQTLVATLDRPLTPEEANKVSVALHQESIAQRVGDTGELYGPKASEWGPFNDKFFLGHSKTGENALMSREASETLRSAAGTALTKQELEVLKSGVPRVAMKRAQRFAALFNQLPATSDYVHAALAGRAARGWYEKSRRAGEAMYGKDYPRFAALMAALSPQTDVPTNFYNAAQVWADWHRSGRPASASDITAILNRNVVTPDGRKGGAEVMDAYKFNTIRALTHKTGDVQLSGPKVESFRSNLIGNLNEVTNDRHVAAFSGIMQELLSGTQIASTDGVGKSFGLKSPGYIAPSVRYRQAARELSKLTGETWAPAEVQETGWSFWRTLYNLATAQGETRSALQLIRDGALTHELIAETPTLGQYFDTKRYGHITRGEKQAPDGDADAAGRISAAERGAARETGPVVETPAVKRIAKRLDRLIENRARLEKLNAEIKAQDEALDVQGQDRAAEIEALESEIERIATDDGFDIPGFDAPRKPDALEAREPEPLWYSALDTAITDKAPWAKDGSIPVNQLRGWLGSKSKDGTFKPDELKWSGLEEFLATKDGRVTRDEVQAFLAGNGVKVQEVTLGNDAAFPQDEYDSLSDRFDQDGEMSESEKDRLEELELMREGRAETTNTKFASYVLPGGQNYRELLLTLPPREDLRKFPPLSAEQDSRRSDLVTSSRRLTDAEAAELALLNRQQQNNEEEFARPKSGNNFQSSHYDKQNILAHIRFNERTDADGKRVLFIEEIQSDWAQKGRKEGFADDAAKALAVKEGTDWARIPEQTRNDYRAAVKGVPAAPFVGKTEAWVALAMKRMIRYAADNGFDRVAWTTGEQQADRYDLSKQLDSIKWMPRPVPAGMRQEGTRTKVFVHLKKGEPLALVIDDKGEVVSSDFAGPTGKGLDEVIGKELAKKVLESESGKLDGLDLKVGGEGMKSFYDKIIPNVANDLLRKMGGGRVGDVLVKQKTVAKIGRNWGILEDDGDISNRTRGESTASIKKLMALASPPQPGFDITPDMAPRARKPQALFAMEPTPRIPAVLYHGGTNFDPQSSRARDGAHWFTDNERHAGSFGDVGVYHVTMTNPLEISQDDLDAEWDKEHPDGDQDERNLLPRDFVKGFVAKAKAAGNDGLIIRRMGDRDIQADMFLPLSADQVRPATARKPDSLDFNLRAAATNVVHDSISTSRSFNLWDRTVGTPYHKASKHAGFKRVYDGVQNFLNDSSQLMMEAADLAPDLLPKLDGLKDLFKKGLSKADLKNVSAAVFEGTLNDTVYTDPQLVARGMNDKQIGYYKQARLAIDKSLTDALTSEAVKQAKNLLPQSVLDQAKKDGDPWVIVDALANIANKTGVQQQVYDQLRLRAAEIEDLKRQGYAPLQRFGQYTVHVVNPDGSSALFTMHESEREANAFARAARATLQPGQKLTQGVMSQEAWKLFQGVSPDTLEIFAESIGASQSETMQKYIKLAANNRSVMKRMLERKEIAGFQTDIQRTLAQFITSNARAAAKNYHWGEVLKATNEIPKEQGDAKDEAVKLKDYLEHPKDEAGALRGLLFIQFLGGSIASAVTNATQPIMMTFPWLSQHGGAANAAIQLAAAGKVAAGGAAEPGLKEALERGTKEGIVSPHEVAGLYAESIRSFGSNMAVRRGLKLWGSLFSLAEQFNRRITFVAAYRTAVKEGMPDPYGFAVNAIAETQGVYNKGNRPNWSRGAVGATLMTFKQYSIAYLEFLNRLPKKQKAIALAALVLAAGLQGLPGADDLEDVIDTIAESLGYSFNSKKQLREWATRTLGESAGAFLVSGTSAIPGVPLDVQGRLGIGNLFPGTGLLKRSNEDKSREVLDFFGPAGSQAKSFLDAFSAAQDGNPKAVAIAALPMAVRNALQGLSMAQSGFYKDTKGRRVVDTDGYDAAIKAIGFQPGVVARQTRVVQDLQQDIGLAKDVETALADRMARAILDKDPEALQKARVELLVWNQTNPGARIAITPAQVQQRVRQAMMSREQRFLKTAPKEMRGGVMTELRPQ